MKFLEKLLKRLKINSFVENALKNNHGIMKSISSSNNICDGYGEIYHRISTRVFLDVNYANVSFNKPHNINTVQYSINIVYKMLCYYIIFLNMIFLFSWPQRSKLYGFKSDSHTHSLPHGAEILNFEAITLDLKLTIYD